MRHPIALLLGLLCAVASAFGQAVSTPDVFGESSTRQFPYSMTGQLIFTSGNLDYQGSGSVVFRRSVLTAAHNLWDADQGWSYNMEFNRARSGRSIARQTFANRMFVLGGYQTFAGRLGADSLKAFAYDMGGVRFASAPADGSYAGWKAGAALLTSAQDATFKICLGYGADTHTGDDLLYVEPIQGFHTTFGAFMENDTLTFEGGMSGGPVYAELADGSLRIVGIVVAGSDDPPSGGIRAIDAKAAQFISTFLRY
jgi:V8-like Glu-specific endopeptidase